MILYLVCNKRGENNPVSQWLRYKRKENLSVNYLCISTRPYKFKINRLRWLFMVNNFLNYSFDYFNFNFNFHCIYLHKLHYLHYTLKYLYHIKMINIFKSRVQISDHSCVFAPNMEENPSRWTLKDSVVDICRLSNINTWYLQVTFLSWWFTSSRYFIRMSTRNHHKNV